MFLSRLIALGLLALAPLLAPASEPLATPEPGDIEYPDGVPPSAALVELGTRLFFDNRLSRHNNQSCATCHNPDTGFGDGLALSRGSEGMVLPRNAPHLYNLAWNVVFFWDGRAATLEEQALLPIQSDKEMNLPMDVLVERLQGDAHYPRWFSEAFGGSGVTPDRIARALAAFERTLVSRDSAFDRYLAGDTSAMSPEAVRGLALFTGKGGCTQCHDGANFTDNSFHNLGVKGSDKGRAAVTADKTQAGAFKTPGLRNVLLTAPYLHDGSLATLEDVVRFYNRGGDTAKGRSELIKPLGLNDDEVRDLVAFMGALTDALVVTRPATPSAMTDIPAGSAPVMAKRGR